MQTLNKIITAITSFRQRHLFIRPSEFRASCDVNQKIAQQLAAQDVEKVIEYHVQIVADLLDIKAEFVRSRKVVQVQVTVDERCLAAGDEEILGMSIARALYKKYTDKMGNNIVPMKSEQSGVTNRGDNSAA